VAGCWAGTRRIHPPCPLPLTVTFKTPNRCVHILICIFMTCILEHNSIRHIVSALVLTLDVFIIGPGIWYFIIFLSQFPFWPTRKYNLKMTKMHRILFSGWQPHGCTATWEYTIHNWCCASHAWEVASEYCWGTWARFETDDCPAFFLDSCPCLYQVLMISYHYFLQLALFFYFFCSALSWNWPADRFMWRGVLEFFLMVNSL